MHRKFFIWPKCFPYILGWNFEPKSIQLLDWHFFFSFFRFFVNKFCVCDLCAPNLHLHKNQKFHICYVCWIISRKSNRNREKNPNNNSAAQHNMIHTPIEWEKERNAYANMMRTFVFGKQCENRYENGVTTTIGTYSMFDKHIYRVKLTDAFVPCGDKIHAQVEPRARLTEKMCLPKPKPKTCTLLNLYTKFSAIFLHRFGNKWSKQFEESFD